MLLGVLLATIILVCIALVAVILLQRSEGGALGMGGGGPGNFMTARGTGDLLTQTTQVLAGLFFALCLAMTLLSGHAKQTSSVVDRLKLSSAPVAPATPAAPTPAASAAPLGLPAPAGATTAPAAPSDPFAAQLRPSAPAPKPAR